MNVCALVPAATASSTAGKAFTSATESDNNRGTFTWFYNGEGLHWSITVYQSPSRATFDDFLVDLGGAANAKPLSGVGDQAYVSPVAVVAKVGDRSIQVGSPNNSEANEAACEALAKVVITALG